MASQWRIRHKLTLGLVLVVGTISLLLGGTLRGLLSYYFTINEIRDSLKELKAADQLKECVADLNWSLSESGEQAEKSERDAIYERSTEAHRCLHSFEKHQRLQKTTPR